MKKSNELVNDVINDIKEELTISKSTVNIKNKNKGKLTNRMIKNQEN
jgi:DNA topoisomerase VI subunit A